VFFIALGSIAAKNTKLKTGTSAGTLHPRSFFMDCYFYALGITALGAKNKNLSESWNGWRSGTSSAKTKLSCIVTDYYDCYYYYCYYYYYSSFVLLCRYCKDYTGSNTAGGAHCKVGLTHSVRRHIVFSRRSAENVYSLCLFSQSVKWL